MYHDVKKKKKKKKMKMKKKNIYLLLEDRLLRLEVLATVTVLGVLL
jgi:hypothetical protein